jgi:homoserine dehydrogenase|tara:strand:- start:1379 stop:2659 length:1281 start_codon:yes stop_codon:yes gene_type:complete
MKSLQIGVCGVGNVGGAVLDKLSNSSEIVEANGGVKIEISQVGARKGKSVVPFDLPVSIDLMEVAENPDIDVLVELIGGCDLAKDLVEKSIKNGKNIVTANKALISTHGDELFELAKTHGVQIGFEASVAGGTPVIKALREGLVANKVVWFAGILNGTTNFILSKMADDKSSFEEALQEAQELGLAESDPTMDIDGTDAAQKATILSALAFNTPFDFTSVSYGGIESVSPEDIKYAEQLGYSIKHIAYGSLDGNEANISAFPTFVPKDQLLSQVGQQMNALEVHCEGIGSTVYYGPGAGPQPTASAVIADLVDISNGGWPESSNEKNKNILSKDGNQIFTRYFNIEVKNEAGAIAKLSTLFAEENISIEALIQKESKQNNENQPYVPVVIISGPLTDKQASEMKNNLESTPETNQKVKQFRIHNVI